MLQDILIFGGAATIALWGVAHIVPTRSVVAGFGALSTDNRRILTMEWIAEGLTLCFIGALAFCVSVYAGTHDPVSILVYRVCAVMLLVMAGLSALTGARTSVVPMRICPFVKGAVAIAFVAGSLL